MDILCILLFACLHVTLGMDILCILLLACSHFALCMNSLCMLLLAYLYVAVCMDILCTLIFACLHISLCIDSLCMLLFACLHVSLCMDSLCMLLLACLHVSLRMDSLCMLLLACLHVSLRMDSLCILIFACLHVALCMNNRCMLLLAGLHVALCVDCLYVVLKILSIEQRQAERWPAGDRLLTKFIAHFVIPMRKKTVCVRNSRLARYCCDKNCLIRSSFCKHITFKAVFVSYFLPSQPVRLSYNEMFLNSVIVRSCVEFVQYSQREPGACVTVLSWIEIYALSMHTESVCRHILTRYIAESETDLRRSVNNFDEDFFFLGGGGGGGGSKHVKTRGIRITIDAVPTKEKKKEHDF